MQCSHGMGITACRSQWQTREDINDLQRLWRTFKVHSKHVFPIHRDLVVRLLQYSPKEHNGGVCGGLDRGCRPCWKSLYEWRNALSSCRVCHTLGCMRPDEGHNSQLCDW